MNSEGALDSPLALRSLPPGVLLGPAAHSPGSEDYVVLTLIRPGSEEYPYEFLVWRDQSQFAFPRVPPEDGAYEKLLELCSNILGSAPKLS